MPELAGDVFGRDHASGRTRLQRTDRRHLLWPDDAAVALHHHDAAFLQSVFMQAPSQFPDVIVDRPREKYVGYGGIDASIFSCDWRDDVRCRYKDITVRTGFVDELDDSLLVLRILPAEKQADRD